MSDSKTADQVHRVAVFGASGQKGFPLARELLSMGHFVLVISRSSDHPKIKELEGKRAKSCQLSDYSNSQHMTEMLSS